nr:hypothetical protein Iba_chr02dCG9290 [Ipomoea batatas]
MVRPITRCTSESRSWTGESDGGVDKRWLQRLCVVIARVCVD